MQSYRALMEDMRRGLAEDQFCLEYQPRFDTDGQPIRSVEALVGRGHPERGQIALADFIPAAERSGLIVPLGAWVLRTACRRAAEWPTIGVSVNVSPVQFQSTDIVRLVAAVLAETGLDPRQLELEITEGVLLEDAQRARLALERLKQRGVRLAIDDFGTGYSSLSSLRAFPFDVINIDRQFITNMEARAGGREVVQAILALRKALGLYVTAEGGETDRQLRLLGEDRCVEVQRSPLARPMSPGDIDFLVAHQSAVAPLHAAAS